MRRMSGYVYLIHVREFLLTGQPVYKFGRTHDIFSRFKQYPNKSKLIFSSFSTDCVSHERVILMRLRRRFTNRKDFGSEYFEGDLNDILFEVTRLVVKLNSGSSCGSVDCATQTVEYPATPDHAKPLPFLRFRYNKVL